MWTAALTLPVVGAKKGGTQYFDWSGLSVIWSSLQAAAKGPAEHNGFSLSIESNSAAKAAATFMWDGVQWTVSLVFARLFWVAAAIAIALLAALLFDRFDPSKEGWRRAATLVAGETVESVAAPQMPAQATPLTPLAVRTGRLRFGAILVAELRLMLKGRKWWWYAVAGGLIIACATTPDASGRKHSHLSDKVSLEAERDPNLPATRLNERDRR